MPEVYVLGSRACDNTEELLPYVAHALEEFLPQSNSQIIREFEGGVLVVTSQQPGADVRQMLFCREDIPQLPEECRTILRRWEADQAKRDALRSLERN
jgi:hypothetical protein